MDCSLYIHIPFCKSKCDYCDFFSTPCSGIIPDDYISAVKNEIAYYQRQYSIGHWNTVYIGGGTPSLLTPSQLQTLIAPISCPDITIEMNPDDITPELLSCAADCGITRLSVGIQALSDGALKTVHRRCTRATSLAALQLIAKQWRGQFSADMISGLPEQTLDVFMQGLRELTSYNPHHISLYSLTIEEETPLGQSIVHNRLSYDYDAADEQWLSGRDFLESQGWLQYEISNFAKPGYESNHNMVYWQLRNYIGVGAGATGTLYGKLHENGLRWTNTTQTATYTTWWNTQGSSPSTHLQIQEKLTPDTQEFEYFMMGLRTRRGVSARTFEARFGKPITTICNDSATNLFGKWMHEKKACITKTPDGDSWYALTAQGIIFLNQFLEELEV